MSFPLGEPNDCSHYGVEMNIPHKEIPAREAAALQAEGAIVVDVREDHEVAAAVLPGVVHIPLGELGARLDEVPRDRMIALICRSGGRSGKAAEFLSEQGYGSVVNLAGGMMALGLQE